MENCERIKPIMKNYNEEKLCVINKLYFKIIYMNLDSFFLNLIFFHVFINSNFKISTRTFAGFSIVSNFYKYFVHEFFLSTLFVAEKKT